MKAFTPSGRIAFSAMLVIWATLLVFVLSWVGDSINAKPVAASETRHYYVAAEEVAWDYAPSNLNQITGQPCDGEAKVFVRNGRDRIGKVYLKALYREYPNGSFTMRKPVPAV